MLTIMNYSITIWNDLVTKMLENCLYLTLVFDLISLVFIISGPTIIGHLLKTVVS
jgi:hypothetical protein